MSIRLMLFIQVILDNTTKQYIDKIERLQKDQKEESFSDELNKVDFKQRIKQLTQEVEACIELLNS